MLALEMLGRILLAGMKERDQAYVEEAAARHSGVQPTKLHLFHAGCHVQPYKQHYLGVPLTQDASLRSPGLYTQSASLSQSQSKYDSKSFGHSLSHQSLRLLSAQSLQVIRKTYTLRDLPLVGAYGLLLS